VYCVELFVVGYEVDNDILGGKTKIDSMILEPLEENFDFLYDLVSFVNSKLEFTNGVLLARKNGLVCKKNFYIHFEEL
jgi:hypothetical protein